MSDRITFTSVRLKSLTRDHKGTTAHFAASMNASVSKAMGWLEIIPEFLTSAKLEGDLAATILELKPKSEELTKHGRELSINRVAGFEAIRMEIKGKKGKGFRTELRFDVKSAQPDAARRFEEYMWSVGEEPSTATVSYDKPTQTSLLPGEENGKQLEVQ
jgi:hypothetical protein